jgi:N-methylhydantoinase B
MTARRGDVFRHCLAGAGGWGDPLERDPAAVMKDVKNELLSQRRAEADYGVVIARGEVDPGATAKRRAELRIARAWREVPKVQRHDPLKSGTDPISPEQKTESALGV